MAEKSFAGFSYQDRIAVGYYGEVFRARSSTQQEVRLLHVDGELASTAGFAEALARFGTDLAKLKDGNAVGTRTMGRALDGTLVVVTEPVNGPVSVDELLEDAPNGLRPEAAVAIARGALAGMAAAHRLAIVHGGLHPRSVLIDFDGQVKLTDFAVARAIAACSARAKGAPLGEAVRGFVAPELKRGAEPTLHSDVYAAGALLFTMLSGKTPPGKLKTTRSLGRVISRALDASVERRFRDAVEMIESLDKLIESGAATTIRSSVLATYVRELNAAGNHHLDGDTDDLLSFIASDNDAADGSGAEPIPRPRPVIDSAKATVPAKALTSALPVGDEGEESATGDDAPTRVQAEAEPLPPIAAAAPPAELDALLDALDGDLGTGVGIDPVPITSEPIGEDAVVSEENHDNTSEILGGDLPTRVDDPAGQAGRDPISELIELDGGRIPDADELHISGQHIRDDETPLPAPVPAHAVPGSFTRNHEELLEGTGQRKRVAAAADAAIAALDLEDEPEEAAPVRAAARPVDIDPVELMMGGRKSRGVLWGGLTVVVLFGIFIFLWTQTDTFHPDRAKRKREQRQKERDAKIRAFNKNQPRPGHISISSEPEGAAVFWKLGRTPLESRQVRTGMIHQLRVEYDGHVPGDVDVNAKHWTGTGDAQRANVVVALKRGDKSKAGPAPKAPSAALSPGPADGKGVIQVKSTPSGAEVWVLIGFTGEFDGFDSQAGLAYEFKVQKKGHQPGYVVVRPEHWRIGGPDGELRSRLVHELQLVPVTGAKKP